MLIIGKKLSPYALLSISGLLAASDQAVKWLVQQSMAYGFMSMSKEEYDAFIGTVSKKGDNIEEFKIENWLDIILASESD